MVKPLLNKPYWPSWFGTDVRVSFDLERRRLAELQEDRLNTAFRGARGRALVISDQARKSLKPGARE